MRTTLMGSPMRAPAAVIQPAQDVIAVEGFLDIIKHVFGGKKSKMDTKSHREQINDAFYKGAVVVKGMIEKTFADRTWVEQHYKPQAHHVNIRDWHYLAFDGKIHQPKEVIDHFLKGFQDAQRKYDGVGQIEKYIKELDEAEDRIEAFYTFHKDLESVKLFALTQMQQIAVPPKMNWQERHNARTRGVSKEVETLPTLTTNQVIEAANEILKVMDVVKKYEGAIWNTMPGSGMDAHDFWGEDEAEGYDGEELRTGDVGDFFYFQSTPDEVCATVSVPFSDLQDSILAVCAWLILTCPS